MPRTAHTGTLRPQIRLIDGGATIEWVDPTTREVVWCETCTPLAGCAFASQIECVGDFTTKPGYFIDSEGKRHFVIQAEPGQLGGMFGG